MYKDDIIDMNTIDSNVFDDISAQDGGLPGLCLPLFVFLSVY